MTTLELPTRQDLENLGKKLDKVLELLEAKRNTEPGEWLKSSDVKKLLQCGDSTLVGYREKGILKYTKIGGTYYYSRGEVEKLLTSSIV